MRRTGPTLLVAIVLAAVALISVRGTLAEPVRWTPDGLFYQARSLELRGMDRETALARTFRGPLASELRAADPTHVGDPAWVSSYAKFYDRRLTVPLAGAALEPVAGDRALLYVSVAGFVAAILALFAFLLLRFPLPVAAAVALAAIFVPALSDHARLPLTDTWGLALQITALACAVLALDRNPRWVVGWTLSILVLGFTRDSTWVLVLAAAFLAFKLRSRVSYWLAGTALAASLPVMVLIPLPTLELFAAMFNDFHVPADPSWRSVATEYPAAIVDLVRSDAGFVRDGAFYSAAYLAGGVALLFAFGRGPRGGPVATLLKAGAVAGVAYVIAVPIFSAFRLDLVLLPMAAFGLGLAVERVAARLSATPRRKAWTHLAEGLESQAARTPAP
jgi:hypothetical protein